MNPTILFNGHFAGRAFSSRFEKTTGLELTDTLFATRYAPAGHPEVRIRAIDEYWDFQRKAPLQIEQEFFDYSRQVFGDKNFAGIHNTFHNHLTNDEVWATGLNWWTIPRQFGMSDEDLSLPLRMGLLVSHPGNIMYDQFYGWDIHRFATKALNDARFDARLHYHGYNDTGRWGTDLSMQPFLSSQNPVERKIRLLNHFDPAAPKLPLLIVFGMPALLNWYPDHDARNLFDINGSLHIEEQAIAVWDAGYRCAVVPSDLIDNGSLKLDAHKPASPERSHVPGNSLPLSAVCQANNTRLSRPVHAAAVEPSCWKAMLRATSKARQFRATSARSQHARASRDSAWTSSRSLAWNIAAARCWW